MDGIDQVRQQIEAAQQTGPPDERRAKLRIRLDDLLALVGTIEAYLADDDLLREADRMRHETRAATARHNATLREEMLRRGASTAEELDEGGMLSHETLDALAEEGLLEAALGELYPLGEAAGFADSLHPHDRLGRFRDTYGHVFAKAAGAPTARGRTGARTHPTPHGPKPPPAPKPKLKVPEKVERPVGTSAENQAKAEALAQRTQRQLQVARSGRRLAQAEAHFNPSGSVSQHTLLAFVRDAASSDDTFDKYARVQADGSVQWSSKRRELHEAIIDAMMREPRIDENGDLHMDPDGKELEPDPDGPKMLASGGGYAAGKGGSIKLARKEGRVPESAITLDPDRIKAMLPEYQDALDADDPEGNLHTYREAWEIAQEVQRRAIDKKLNMIVDGVSDTSSDEIMQRVQGFTDAGYSATVLYTDIPTDEALKRAAGRAAGAKADADRRHIPEVIMRAVHRDVAATIPDFLEKLAGPAKTPPVTVQVYDNDQGKDPETGKFRGPKLFATYDPDSGMQVVDEPLWMRLKEKAGEKIEGVDLPRHPA